VAGDGLLPWSEVAAIAGKRTVPLPFVGKGVVTGALRRVGLDLPPELIDLLTYGRGIDNRRLKAEGFKYQYTSAGAVEAFMESLRLRRSVGNPDPPWRYDEDVEQFFRHSPAVVRDHPSQG
jgi:UDP-glucose 4-epimerase